MKLVLSQDFAPMEMMGKIFPFHIFHESLVLVHQASECENPLAWLNYYSPKISSLDFFL